MSHSHHHHGEHHHGHKDEHHGGHKEHSKHNQGHNNEHSSHKEHDSNEYPYNGKHAQYSSKSSGIKDYGCWKGTPVSYTAQTLEQDKSPHLTLKFTDNTGGTHEANINVASTDSDHDLVYWLQRQWHHPITKALTPLSDGFHKAQDDAGTGLSLDYLRTKPALIDLSAGTVMQNTDQNAKNDILNSLEPIVQDAINGKATVYAFGSDYGTGIHDVHMNQGNEGNFVSAVGSDGAIIFHYAGSDAHFEAVFLAFATQEVPTDDKTGKPAPGAKALDTIATGRAGIMSDGSNASEAKGRAGGQLNQGQQPLGAGSGN